MTPRPPKWAQWILEWYCHPDFVVEIEGDLEELFHEWIEEKGLFRARLLYVVHTLLFLRAYNSRLSTGLFQFKSLFMMRHFLKISIRNFKKNKTYNLANIAGLTVSVAVCIMLLWHVRSELSYEKEYPKHQRIVRVTLNDSWAKSSPLFAEELNAYYSQVELTGRFAKHGGTRSIITVNGKKIVSEHIFFSDQSNIEIFDYAFVAGNPQGALKRPNTAVITATFAQKLFGSSDPLGQVIEMNGQDKFEVTGVIRDLPRHSHIKADVLVSMPTFYGMLNQAWLENRGWMVMYTYALLHDANDINTIRGSLLDFMRYYLPDEWAEDAIASGDRFGIMPLVDIHLHSDKVQEMAQNSNIMYIYVFMTLVAIIGIIASVNFINIFATLVLRRTREVGLRKAIGATRTQLVGQLLTEATFSALLGTFLGFAVCLLLLPYYNEITDASFVEQDILLSTDVLLIILAGIGLGIVSGAYPAWLVTKADAASALATDHLPNTGQSYLRKGLIIFQFVLSLFILIGTVTINRQIDFIQNTEMGYDSDHVVALKTYGAFQDKLLNNRATISHRLEQIPSVTKVALTSSLIGEPLSVEDFDLVSASPDDPDRVINFIWAGENYLDLMGIDIVGGRNFHAQTDTSTAFIVNERFLDVWQDNVLGEMAEYRGQRGPIVGVMEDFNYYSLHHDIEPVVICYRPSWANQMLFKVSGNPTEALIGLDQTIREIDAEFVSHYTFLDNHIAQLYAGEQNMLGVFRVFSIVGLIISFVGMLGLAAMEVQYRTKEVGIRKVLGASGLQLIGLLSGQFARMLLLSILIGIPLSYFAIQEWLANFAYTADITLWIFVLPSIAVICVALILVASRIMVTVWTNPVKVLRYE